MESLALKVREAFEEGDNIRDAGLTTPDDVERFDDIVYGPDKDWQVLDVYRPKGMDGKKLPVIVSIHGGGWVYGDKERYQYYCMSLAQQGFAVVNFTYRLAPEFKFPASLEDTNLVMDWVVKNGRRYDMDTQHVFAVGDSAGAHNLGLYTAIYTNPEYAKNYDFKINKNLHLIAIALNCGAFNITISDDETDMTSGLMKELLPEHGTEEELALISACNHITEDYLPAFVMTCTGDFLADQGPLMVETLMEHKIPHVFRFYGDKDHELGHVFHCNMKLAEAKKCNTDECDFFKSFL